jgi:hypothetical protein
MASWLGIATVVSCGFLLDGSTAMPGTAAIVVVAGASAVLVAGDPRTAWSPIRLLGLRPIQFLGDISYALYLWHWPLIVLLPYYQGHPNGNRTLWGILVLSILLATASTYLVENPARRSPRLRRPSMTLAFTAVGALVVVLPSLQLIHSENEQIAQDRHTAATFLKDPPRCAGAASHDPGHPCHNPALDRILVPTVAAAAKDRARDEGRPCASREPDEPIVPCTGGNWDDPSIPKVAIIGDSHARMMSTLLQRLAARGVLAWDGYFQSGCVWGADPPHRTKFTRECVSFKDRLKPILEARADRYDFFVTTGRVSRLNGSPSRQAAGLAREWRIVSDLGKAVVALTDVPEMGHQVGDCLDRVARDDVSACGRKRSAVLPKVDPMQIASASVPHSSSIDMRRYYCDSRTCPAVIGGVVVYADSNHLTATYVSTLTPIFARELKRLRLLPR